MTPTAQRIDNLEQENLALRKRIKELEQKLLEKSWENEYVRDMEEASERGYWR